MLEGQLFVRIGQFQYLRRTPLWDTQVLFRTDVQLSTSALLSLELRIPLLAGATGQSFLQLAPFADIGRSWNTDRGEIGPDTLYSAGVDLRWQITQQLGAKVY